MSAPSSAPVTARARGQKATSIANLHPGLRPICHGLLCACAALLASCGGGTEPGPTVPNLPDTSGPGAGWQLVWQDEFDQGQAPDTAKWAYDTERNKQGWWNNELQYYSAHRTENARVEGGKLHITARQERLTAEPDHGGQNYTSARLMTRGKASWTYGRFEIRAKLPCTLGTWPAIWMLGTGGQWPQDGEIDILEQKGFNAAEKRQVLGTVHMQAHHGGGSLGATQALASACTDFNTYQMTWNAQRITIGVNGTDYFSYANPQNGDRSKWPFDRPQYLLLNVAVGGDLGGKVDSARLPASMEVDWVRVYQRTP